MSIIAAIATNTQHKAKKNIANKTRQSAKTHFANILVTFHICVSAFRSITFIFYILLFYRD